jgi:hypothetical protein
MLAAGCICSDSPALSAPNFFCTVLYFAVIERAARQKRSSFQAQFPDAGPDGWYLGFRERRFVSFTSGEGARMALRVRTFRWQHLWGRKE